MKSAILGDADDILARLELGPLRGMRSRTGSGLPKRLRRDLEKMARAEGVSSSEYVRRAIKADIFRRALRATRRELVPKERAMGIYTDEDVFKIVS